MLAHLDRYRNASGSWTFRARWTAPDGRRESRILCRTERSPTKKSLQVWEKRAADDLHYLNIGLNREHPERRAEDTPALPDACRQYVAWMLDTGPLGGKRARSTAERVERVIRGCVVWMQAHGREYVGGIVAQDIAHWCRSMLADGLAASTVSCYMADVSGWLAWCAKPEQGWFDANPARNVARPQIDHRADQVKLARPDEFWYLLDNLPNDLAVALTGILATTGLRIGEARTLTLQRWDRQANLLRMGAPEDDATAPPERTKRHRRTIPVCPLCDGWLSILTMHATDGPWLFSTNRGASPITSQLHAWLKPANVSPHDMRRFFRTGLEAIGAYPYEVDDLMGHKTGKTRAAYTPRTDQEWAPRVMRKFQAWLEP